MRRQTLLNQTLLYTGEEREEPWPEAGMLQKQQETGSMEQIGCMSEWPSQVREEYEKRCRVAMHLMEELTGSDKDTGAVSSSTAFLASCEMTEFVKDSHPVV